VAIVLGSGCYLNAVDAYTLSTLPPAGEAGYGTPGTPGAGACVNVGVSKGSGQYVMGGDRLVFTAWGSVGGYEVRLAGQQITPDCKVTPFLLTLTPDDQVTPAVQTLTLVEGMISSLSVKVENAAIQRGQIYVRAEVGIFNAGAFAPYATLIADYVWGSFQPNFPPAQPRGPREGPGFLRFLFSDDFVAGNDWYFIQEATRVWRALAANFTLVTDATAGNRQVIVRQSSLLLASDYSPASKVQPASKSFTYNYSRGAKFADNALTNAVGSFSETHQGESTGSDQLQGQITSVIGAGDLFRTVYALVEEWLNI
jgi:hypothetical protein